jgi:hypothetical protein
MRDEPCTRAAPLSMQPTIQATMLQCLTENTDLLAETPRSDDQLQYGHLHDNVASGTGSTARSSSNPLCNQ